ncbi:MAG: hypothetical protein Q8880_09905 [Bacteroidota bacterium]|nr:hypothetical protein [Bacteroidota bacterium]
MGTTFNPQGLQGNVNKINYYERDGKTFARKARKPNPTNYLTDPNHYRVVENIHELIGCVKVTQNLRINFGGNYKTLADSHFHNRLVSVLKKICKLANGVRGERPINISEHKEMLQNMEFDIKSQFSVIFNAPFSLTATPDRTGSTFTLLPCKPVDCLDIPQNSTHFRVDLAMASISDYEYDSTVIGYLPSDPVNNKLFAGGFSDYLPVNADIIAPVPITATFTGAPVIGADVSVIVAVGSIFYQQVDIQQYKFLQNSCMKFQMVI